MDHNKMVSLVFSWGTSSLKNEWPIFSSSHYLERRLCILQVTLVRWRMEPKMERSFQHQWSIICILIYFSLRENFEVKAIVFTLWYVSWWMSWVWLYDFIGTMINGPLYISLRGENLSMMYTCYHGYNCKVITLQ